jgi:hypothetical protein
VRVSVSDLELFERWKAAGMPEPSPRIQSLHSRYRLTPVTDEEPLTPRDLGGPRGLIPGYSEKRIRQCARWSVNHHDPGRDPFRFLKHDSEKEGHPYLYIDGPGPKELWDILEIVSYQPLGSIGRPYKGAEWRFRRLRYVPVEVC